jgi:hypothetical protein
MLTADRLPAYAETGIAMKSFASISQLYAPGRGKVFVVKKEDYLKDTLIVAERVSSR